MMDTDSVSSTSSTAAAARAQQRASIDHAADAERKAATKPAAPRVDATTQAHTQEARGRDASTFLHGASATKTATASAAPAMPRARASAVPAAKAEETRPKSPSETARDKVNELMKGDSWKTPEGARAAAAKIKQAVAGLPQHDRESVLRNAMKPLSQLVTDPKTSRDQRLAVAHQMAPVMSADNMQSVSMAAREGGATKAQQTLAYAALDKARTDNVVDENKKDAGRAQSSVPIAHELAGARDFVRGFIDGAVDTVKGLGGVATAARLAYRYATDDNFKAHVDAATKAVETAMKDPEIRKLVKDAAGTALGDAAKKLDTNPAYASGYIAGSLAVGFGVGKAVATAGKAVGLPAALSRVFGSALGLPSPAGALVRGLSEKARAKLEDAKKHLDALRTLMGDLN